MSNYWNLKNFKAIRKSRLPIMDYGSIILNFNTVANQIVPMFILKVAC